MYLLDTNICIFAIKQKPKKVFASIKMKAGEGIYISSLTLAELEFGVQNSERIEKNQVALLKFISFFNILNFDDSDAINYGRIKAKLRKEGKIIGPIDMLLAAQALSRGMILITNNLKEFRRVEGLKIEDWSTYLLYASR